MQQGIESSAIGNGTPATTTRRTDHIAVAHPRFRLRRVRRMNSVRARAPTFLFADLTRFTALTEASATSRRRMSSRTSARRSASSSRPTTLEEVKAIGDALMLHVSGADGAIELGVRIVEEVGARHYFPVVRVDMHSGPAVSRAGDWFGATVNLAARGALAGGGSEVLLTEATRHAGGRRLFKNVAEPVDVYAAMRLSARSRRRAADRSRLPHGRRPNSQPGAARVRRRRVPLLLAEVRQLVLRRPVALLRPRIASVAGARTIGPPLAYCLSASSSLRS